MVVEDKCHNATFNTLDIHKVRRKYIQPLHPIFTKSSRVCAVLEKAQHFHSSSQQSGRCMANNITIIERSSDATVAMNCSDKILEPLSDVTSNGPIISAEEFGCSLYILAIYRLSVIIGQ